MRLAGLGSDQERYDLLNYASYVFFDAKCRRRVLWFLDAEAAHGRRLSRFATATLLIGTIARKPNDVYSRLASPDLITERFLLNLRDGRSQVQYVF
jgi:hypothetical protein